MNKDRRKRLQRIDLNVMNRLIRTLHENVREKKTNIARKANMGYDKCTIYLGILEMMDFVKKETDGRYELVSLTSAGIKYLEKIWDEKQLNLQ